MAESAPNSKAVFDRALEIESPAAREAYLAEACAGDAALRQKVDGLLQAYAGAGSFLETAAPIVGDAPGPTADFHDKDERPGAMIAGKYSLVEVIGEGGMGSVWRAKQSEPVKRFVAVKLIKAGMDSKQVLARFDAERQALAMMDHPNIAKVLDGGLHERRPYFVMELVKGVPITEYCDAKRLTPKERLELFVPVCQALQHAHQKGIIHRDIKPTNVLVALYDDKPVVKVIDFGVAKATGGTLTEQTIDTGFGGVVGTPEYMSPEQATFNNLDVDTRSDVYALGALLYELLTGSPPFSRKELEKRGLLEILRVVREEEPPRPSTKLSTADALPSISANRGTEPKKLTGLLRNELDWIVMKALEKDRARRYETANGFAADVLRYLSGEAVLAHPPSSAYRLKKFVKRHKGQMLAAAAVTMALVAGVASVVVVQARANLALTGKNDELAAKNVELAEEQAKVQARFDTAVKAIETFHTGVSEDMLLKNEQFKELRTKLLKEAAGFYGELEKLLQGQTDSKSRKTLAAGYFQLGNLTEKIGDKTQALAAHRKALMVRRELAAAPDADVEPQLDVARSLATISRLLDATGGYAEALAAELEVRGLAERLETQHPTDAVRALHAQSHAAIGYILTKTGKLTEALAAYQKALAIREKLKEAGPDNSPNELARCHNLIGWLLSQTGKPADALAAYKEGLAIQEKLVAANPAVSPFQSALAGSHNSIGGMLSQTGKPADALAAYQKARDIQQKLADANPAVHDFQSALAGSHNNIGLLLSTAGKPADALAAYQKARDIQQKLADANPAVHDFQSALAWSHNNIGLLLSMTGRPADALAAYQEGLAIEEKLVEAQPADTDFQSALAWSQSHIGHLLRDNGKPLEALKSFKKALAIQQKLADANPIVTGFQNDLALYHQCIGHLQSQSGNAKEAFNTYHQALAIRQQLVDANPAVTDFRRHLAASHNNLADLLLRDNRAAEARDEYQQALAVGEPLARDNPTNTWYQTAPAFSLRGRGKARLKLDELAGAADDTRRSLAIWDRLPTRRGEDWFETACCHAARAGLAGREGSGIAAQATSIEADQALTLLKKAADMGYTSFSNYRDESALDPLRGREDFKKLVADLEKKSAPTKEATPKPPERK